MSRLACGVHIDRELGRRTPIARWDMIEAISGFQLGDKGYLRPWWKTELSEHGVQMVTPLCKNMNDGRESHYMRGSMTVRRRVETAISKLSERFRIEKVWVRDLWY